MSRKRALPPPADQSEDENENENENESIEDDAEGSEDEGEAEANNHRDGFANTILNLLKQDTGKKAPVLSGRKTTLMKQIDEHKTESKSLERKKLEKRRKLEEKIMHSDEINIEFERQLKKLATKGVVALFNCVAKAKKEMNEENNKAKAKSKPKELPVASSEKAFSASFVIGEKKESSKETKPSGAKKWSVVDENATEGLLMVRSSVSFPFHFTFSNSFRFLTGLGSGGVRSTDLPRTSEILKRVLGICNYLIEMNRNEKNGI